MFGGRVVVRGVTSQDNGVNGLSGSSMSNSLLLDSVLSWTGGTKFSIAAPTPMHAYSSSGGRSARLRSR